LNSSEQKVLSDAYNGIIAGLSILDRQVNDLRDGEEYYVTNVII